MHFYALGLIAALSAVAVAQDITQLPQCAMACVGNNLGSCNDFDIPCICRSSDLISNLSCCVANECSAEDQQATINFAVNLCKPEGVDLPTTAACTTGASATSTASAASSTSASGASTTAAASSSSMDGAEDSSATASSAAAEQTGGASHLLGSGVGVGAGAAVAGLLVLL